MSWKMLIDDCGFVEIVRHNPNRRDRLGSNLCSCLNAIVQKSCGTECLSCSGLRANVNNSLSIIKLLQPIFEATNYSVGHIGEDCELCSSAPLCICCMLHWPPKFVGCEAHLPIPP